MHVLVVDDEELIRSLIRDYLENEGIEVTEAENGFKAIEFVEQNDYSLIIMDIMMPVKDGYETVKEIKEMKDIPVIMLSARNDEFDKLHGFDIGIDDYVTKPFSPKELIARIKAVTKRNKEADTINVGDIKINNLSREVTIDSKKIEMTHTQFELLLLFVTNEGIALSREKIIESIWGYDYDADDRTIDAHIKLLRNKLGKYRNSIKTIRKVGYKFDYEEK